MKTKHRFSEGYSLNYLVHSVVLLIITLILGAVYHWMLLLIGGFFVVALLGAKTGIELDLKAKTFSSYRLIMGKEIRKTINISSYKTGRLIFVNESNTFHSRFQSNTYKVQTHNLELFTSDLKVKRVYEFQDYQAARKIIDLLRQQLKIEIQDEWQERQILASRNRRR